MPAPPKLPKSNIYLSMYLLPFRRLIATSFHFSLSLAILVHSCSFSPLQLLMFPSQLLLGFRLGLAPSTRPSNMTFKRPSCLLMWPKYFAFLSLTNPTNTTCLRPAICNISLLVFICFHDTFNILLYVHISKDEILLSMALLTVHVSTPYNRTDHT